MKRPAFHPHYDCLTHWMSSYCLGCLYDAPELGLTPWWWPIVRPLRIAFYRVVARIDYSLPDPWGVD